ARRLRNAVPQTASPPRPGQCDLLGAVALSTRPAGIQISLPAPLPRPLADAGVLRLAGVQRCRHIVPGARGQGLYLLPAPEFRRGGGDVLACDHGREGAAVGAGERMSATIRA